MKKDFFVFKNCLDVNIFCTVTLFLVISSCAVNAYQPTVTIGKPRLDDIQYALNGLYLATYWDGKDNNGDAVGSGLYFYTIYAGDFLATRKMILLK